MCPEYPGVTLTIEIVSSRPITSAAIRPKQDLATTPQAKGKPAKAEYHEDEENQNSKMLVTNPFVTVSPLVSPGPYSDNNLKRPRETVDTVIDPNDDSVTEPESPEPKFHPSLSTTGKRPSHGGALSLDVKKTPKYERSMLSGSGRKY
ncbi:hypothetical protein JVT61DRAFT_1363 [Boletus reticuloceps]|uniref:Uncharacterized protein n=1 Tax=Boletus reticuloceps TaxID=495285 RepID=A0A8I2YC52_9AGAM|nr:hypothetical protein JVT61DRAFT_1358 [Boletus reticuloceps]KAG6369175.1 hypothetical protein JVT61DRAFT_1363 [Boletus reticuloceps]